MLKKIGQFSLSDILVTTGMLTFFVWLNTVEYIVGSKVGTYVALFTGKGMPFTYSKGSRNDVFQITDYSAFALNIAVMLIVTSLAVVGLRKIVRSRANSSKCL